MSWGRCATSVSEGSPVTHYTPFRHLEASLFDCQLELSLITILVLLWSKQEAAKWSYEEIPLVGRLLNSRPPHLAAPAPSLAYRPRQVTEAQRRERPPSKRQETWNIGVICNLGGKYRRGRLRQAQSSNARRSGKKGAEVGNSEDQIWALSPTNNAALPLISPAGRRGYEWALVALSSGTNPQLNRR